MDSAVKGDEEKNNIQLCPTLCNPWTVACKASLCLGFSRQEYWSGLPCPPPADLPDPGIECLSHISCIAGGFFTTRVKWTAVSQHTCEDRDWELYCYNSF